MRDSDWSRKFLLRSDWLLLIVASMTTDGIKSLPDSPHLFIEEILYVSRTDAFLSFDMVF